MKTRHTGMFLSLVICGLIVVIGCDDKSGSGGERDPREPEKGATEFVSADLQDGNGMGSYEDVDVASDGGDSSADSDDRSVEEGDIYRVLAGNKILNLNSYRGLQVIDFSNSESPVVVGRLPITGTPVEMYVVDHMAYLLINHWRSYYGTRDDIKVDTFEGGLIAAVDISDLENPVLVGKSTISGQIVTSRMTLSETNNALYVVANVWNWDEVNGSTDSTVVKSFSLQKDGQLEVRSELGLGGYVQDIQATTEALLVARFDWNWDTNRSTVSIIDITDPEGTMVEGAEIEIEGRVQKKTDMNIYKNILRVVSSSTWSGTNRNHLQTFNIENIHSPILVDHDSFGENEDLYASLFLENKAFFVTYFRMDPFHAFEIDDDGNAVEKAEYIISGWNDFFRPVFDDNRLIGIGKNDEGGTTMAVSLYDIVDLSNPSPFIARSEVSADSSWSEASYDDRAFSVLEGAVETTSEDGTIETGLILLPFSGYKSDGGAYTAAVQIFTFSDSTITRRGVMNHGTSVRRSFVANDEATANLSEASLSLYDTVDPDEPELLGTVNLAPNYGEFFVFGDYGVRVKRNRDSYSWRGENLTTSNDQFQVISMGEHPDGAASIASVDIHSEASIYKVGSLLVEVFTEWIDLMDKNGEWVYETSIRVHDLSDPTKPKTVSEFVSSDIHNSAHWGGGMWEEDFMFSYYPSYENNAPQVVGDALVFPKRIYEEAELNIEYVCYTYAEDNQCWQDYWRDDISERQECDFFYGGRIECSGTKGENNEICSGEFEKCFRGSYDCEPVDLEAEGVGTYTECEEYAERRYWNHFELAVLDLSDPNEPSISEIITMPANEEASGLFVDGSSIYVSYSIPIDMDDDPRAYVKYFFKKLDLRNPSEPVHGAAVNVPGTVIGADGDTIYTRDFTWGETIIETAINKLEVKKGKARLESRLIFENQEIDTIVMDEHGHAFVTHYLSWDYVEENTTLDWDDVVSTLSVVDLSGDKMAVISDFVVDDWATLRSVSDGRALFSVYGGLLVVNTTDLKTPFAQAYFPVQGWPNDFTVIGNNVIFAAGRYGIFQFDLLGSNLETLD